MKRSFGIEAVTPYINWLYLYHTWHVKSTQPEARELYEDAMQLLDTWRGEVHTHALFALYDCHSSGDDIVLPGTGMLPMLRQQCVQPGEPCLCLSDFINPNGDRIGMFCCTCDARIEGDDYQRLLGQSVADRLAEATAELLHQQVRREIWGYAPDESLTMEQLHSARYQGIRPAVGYPCMPDQSLNFVLDSILHFGEIGVQLTENGAMMPHASVSGLMISHPSARYFAVGAVGEDQLADYARRRGMDAGEVRRYVNTITST